MTSPDTRSPTEPSGSELDDPRPASPVRRSSILTRWGARGTALVLGIGCSGDGADRRHRRAGAGQRQPDVDELDQHRRPGSGQHRIRPGHGGAPRPGRPDGAHRRAQLHRQRSPSHRLRHRIHPDDADRHDAGLARPLGCAQAHRRRPHGLDGLGRNGRHAGHDARPRRRLPAPCPTARSCPAWPPTPRSPSWRA